MTETQNPLRAQAASPRWFFGPVPDLLWGCGVAYALVFALLSIDGPSMRSLLPVGLLPLAILFTGIPHFGATLLRVYARREDRRATLKAIDLAEKAGDGTRVHKLTMRLALYNHGQPFRED